jgi:hypothetical protein
MSDDQISIFDEMTAAADAMRATVDRLNRYDLQIEFRQIVRARRPDLSREEWLAMFELWIEGYVAKCERRREESIAWFVRTIDEYANANVPEDPWVCPCGEVLDNPCDPDVMAVHQPHYLAAKAARR